MRIQGRGGGGGGGGGGRGRESGPPLKNHKILGFLCNTGPDPLKNHKIYQASMASRWQADGGPLVVIFGSSFPLIKKKIQQKNLSEL